MAQGRVADLARGGQLKIAVKVTGDDQGLWTANLAGLAVVERITAGTATLSLAKTDDAQAVLDVARRAGPVEQFGFERRRLSEVFRDAVGADVADAGPAGAAAAQPGEPDEAAMEAGARRWAAALGWAGHSGGSSPRASIAAESAAGPTPPAAHPEATPTPATPATPPAAHPDPTPSQETGS